MRSSLVILLAGTLLLNGCATCTPPIDDAVAVSERDGQNTKEVNGPQIQNRMFAIILFPINVIPDMLSNFFVSIFAPASVENQFGPSCTFILAPLSGIGYGIKDAWQGYLFYDPAIIKTERW